MANEIEFRPHEKESALDLLDRILSLSPAQQTELVLDMEAGALTRFAGNQIHQNMSSRDCRLSIRAIENNGIGYASTNRFDADSVKNALEWARRVARSGKIPVEPNELPGPQQY